MSHSNSDCGTMVPGCPSSDPSSSTRIAFFSPSQSISTQSAGLIFLLDNKYGLLPSKQYKEFGYYGIQLYIIHTYIHTYIHSDTHTVNVCIESRKYHKTPSLKYIPVYIKILKKINKQKSYKYNNNLNIY